MKELSFIGKFFHFIYQQIFLRFSGQIRDPYLIRIDKIFTDPNCNQLLISFHIANKRISQVMTVAQFVKSEMIYLVDPRLVFDIGQQFGAYSEKLITIQKIQPGLKDRCVSGLKRVFIDG